MKQKIKIVLFLFVLFLLVNTITTTYAKYVTASTGTITTQFAKWQISVNNSNITTNYNASVSYTPTFQGNDNVKNGTIAPGAEGYFDIQIDPSNADVSFRYTINMTQTGENDVVDIAITDYAVFNTNELNPIISRTPTDGTNISGIKLFNNSFQNFTLEPFTVRIYFKWIDDETNLLDDEADTQIGIKAANGEEINNNYTISIQFSQYLE